MTLTKSLFATVFVLTALGLACSKTDASAAPATQESAPSGSAQAVEGRLVEVVADIEGYAPKEIAAKVGETLTLRFVRKTESSCLAEIVFPSLNIKKDLPLGKPVDVVIKAEQAGEIKFQCGMAMIFGKIVVS